MCGDKVPQQQQQCEPLHCGSSVENIIIQIKQKGTFIRNKHLFSGLQGMNSNNSNLKYVVCCGYWQSLNIKSEFISILKEQLLALMNAGKHPLCQMALIEGFPFSWMACYGFIQMGLRWRYCGTANHLHWDAKITLCLSSKLLLWALKLAWSNSIYFFKMVAWYLSWYNGQYQGNMCKM